MQRQLAEPRQVYLCSSDHQSQLHPELVESSSTLSNVMDLLQLRSLTAGPFHKEEDGSSSIVVKRQDGSSTRLVVGAGDSISDLESKISAAQQVRHPGVVSANSMLMRVACYNAWCSQSHLPLSSVTSAPNM